MTSSIDIKTLQKQYWERLTTQIIENYPLFEPRKPDRNAYYLPLGSKYAHISMKVNSMKKIEECKIVISHNKKLFDYLKRFRKEIERKLGFELDWNRKEGVESHITVYNDFDIRNINQWNMAIKWHLDTALILFNEFSYRIKQFSGDKVKGRDKCELLNEIRQKIADENDIEFTIYECTFEGDCTGTCPKCESELKYLEAELAKKQARGEKIKLEGIFTLEPTEDEPPCDIFPYDRTLDGLIFPTPLEGDIDYDLSEYDEKIRRLLGDVPVKDEKNEKD